MARANLSSRIFDRGLPNRGLPNDAAFSSVRGPRVPIPPLQRLIIGAMSGSLRDRKRMVRLYRNYVILTPAGRSEIGEPRQRGLRRHMGLFLMLMARDRAFLMLVMLPLAVVLYLFVILH